MFNSSIQFNYKIFEIIFDRTMAWFDSFYSFEQKKIFYLKHGISLFQISIVRFNLPTNEISADWVVEWFRRWIDCLFNTFCVRCFKSQLCWLVFKNIWTEFCDLLFNSIDNNSPRICQITSCKDKIGSHFFGICLSRVVKQLNVGKF